MATDRERASDDLIEESARSRKRLAEVTARLNWLVSELQREAGLKDEEHDE